MRKLLYFLSFSTFVVIFSISNNTVLSQINKAEHDQNIKPTRSSASLQKNEYEFSDVNILGKLSCDTGQPVEVEATSGVNSAGYTTLGAAFSSINSGIHLGDISIEICADVNEGGTPATINSSGAGSASYTSIRIFPLQDAVKISGNPVVGLGLIQLNGADNVTIDGDNPNSAGIQRNLTIDHIGNPDTNYSSVIRIATSSSVLSSDNISIKNLILIGSAVGKNTASETSTGQSENTSFGVYAGGNGGVTDTSPPSPIGSVSTVVMGANQTINGLILQNNRITSCARAVVFLGSQLAHSDSILVEGNEIGEVAVGAITGVYSKGISVNGGSNNIVSNNTVYVESFLTSAISGIEIGTGGSGTVGSTLITKNRVLKVLNNRPIPTGAYGINLIRSPGHNVINNFVSGIMNNQTSSGGDFTLTNAAVGIRVGVATGHKIIHNSVHLYGSISGSQGNNVTTAFGIVSSSQTGLEVRNNIFSNQISGGGVNWPDSMTVHTVLALPFANFSLNLHLNNNAYYQGSSANSRLAKRGESPNIEPEDLFLASNFNSASTSPTTNLRSFTATLRSDEANDNASHATTVAPPFVSDADLHLLNAQGTFLNNNGVPTSVIDDIDGNTRGSLPDIGADEIMPPTSAPADISGRVLTANGRGVAGAVLTVAGGNLDHPRIVITNPFGFYRFEGLATGQTYIVSVGSKRFNFAKPSRAIELLDNINGYDFIAEP